MQVRLHSRRFLAGFRPTPWDGLAFALIFGLLLLFGHGVREAWQPLAILQAEPVSLDPANLPAYALYTIAPETVAKFGSRKLAWTIPFVAMGLWRYFHLVYRREEGGRPERVLLTDPAMIGILAAYTATILVLIT